MTERLEVAWNEIDVARQYTLGLLADLTEADWFWVPTPAVTCIAWQVGHLAMAEYRLALERIRGPRPDDEAVIPAQFLAQFAKGATPSVDPGEYPEVASILRVFTAVHEAARSETAILADSELDQPPLRPHPLFSTKWGSLQWCARHEMLHAGQIGLLRRLQGRAPLW